ncbi:MAG: type 4a pilus biogenesis protein PilO [Fibrobacter sp.]|jgi:type IV pilus assembly protein PilO|nr:type 4a pilus biogenesis protein PilO [Fibrobacter sp.]
MGNLNIDFKDKKNIYCIVMIVLILLLGYTVYTYVWDPFVLDEQNLQSQLESAQKELNKINSKKHRVAELEMQLAQAEKDFQKLKEMFPEEEKVPLRLQDLYSVLRSSGVQIQKFNPEGRSEREHYIENRYSIAVNSGYHMLGYLFAEIANFNYPTAITNLKLSRYSGIAAEVQKAETHGWTPITMSVNFNLTTYTSKKVGN